MKRLWLLFLIFLFPFIPAQAQQETNLPAETVLLNSGWEMPLYGIDFSALSPVQAENAVYLALQKGFRLIDFSGSSGNEEAVGRGIRKAEEEKLVTREDIFLTAGIWPDESEEDPASAAETALQRLLKSLNVDYIDLLIINQNRVDMDLAAYEAAEKAVESGIVRSIGLSGFSETMNFDLIVNLITIPPAVLRVETHPYLQNHVLQDHISQYGTVLAAVNPLGGKDDKAVLFADPAISVPATWYRKTSDQVILRWHLQRGSITLPSAADEARIDEYRQVLDFELSETDMAAIDALDRSLFYVYY